MPRTTRYQDTYQEEDALRYQATWKKIPRVPRYRYPEEDVQDYQVPSYLEENAQGTMVKVPGGRCSGPGRKWPGYQGKGFRRKMFRTIPGTQLPGRKWPGYQGKGNRRKMSRTTRYQANWRKMPRVPSYRLPEEDA
jgi:hypothetical protein